LVEDDAGAILNRQFDDVVYDIEKMKPEL